MNSVIKLLTVSMFGMILVFKTIIGLSASTVEYSYVFCSNESGRHKTAFVLKEDDSPMYMHCEYSNTPFMASALGADEHGVMYYDCSYDWSELGPNDSPYTYTNKFSYLFTNGQKRYIYNFVLKNGFEYGGISVAAISGSGADDVVGMWSVDSVYDANLMSTEEYFGNS